MNITDKPQVGDRIVHGTFGPGVVTATKGESMIGERDGKSEVWDVIRVDFGRCGTRELVWTFACKNIERETT